ncbi:Rieske 2Fe-2S domain-containing protein [Parahaliea mediterranea]|uniref:Rieske 2Fe-2S domain-containing protein n=1 Tax=Parahaliea mediterranea TaxID=651086 RepID=UPI0019D4BBC7|nr:Rieske 2Fe-2S domain-containing protein [Parahaliea mediterranea]
MNMIEPYTIEHRPTPERYARGWYVIGSNSSITTTPTTLSAFGTKLVAYRGQEDNQVHILDGYCPHMGGDLSRGEVCGNSVICPFHLWRWGADGVCDHIPYAKRIPPKAVIKSWPVLEKNGLVMVWQDPENNPPIPEQEPVDNADWYSGEWTDWEMHSIPIQSQGRELVDNMADMAHFGPVHYSSVKSFKNVMDGHRFIQYMVGGHQLLTDSCDDLLTSVATYEGPAYMTTAMTGSMEGQPMAVHLLVSHIPVDTNNFIINFGVMMKKSATHNAEENRALLAAYTEKTLESFHQDVAIWNNKCLIDNPLLCDGDGPIHLVRKWYSQFMTDVADIRDDQVRAREHVTVEGPSVEDTLAVLANRA